MSSPPILIGPIPPFRAGVAYCLKRLAEELEAPVISFTRQYPRRLYPGGSDVDPTLPPFPNARYLLDILNPLTWLRVAFILRRARPEAVIFAWWVWLWGIPFLLFMALLPRKTRVIFQCHTMGDKEPNFLKRWLTELVLGRADVVVVHAETEAEEARERLGPRGPRIVKTFLPVHEMGGAIPTREEARRQLGLSGNVALFFGHVRPFKALDVVLRAWRLLESDATLVVAGQAWWNSETEYRQLAKGLENVRLDFRYIPDAEIATYFAAADVVLAPYRVEAQSGVALTAFHFARPVISTNVGGLPEIIREGETGMMVPPDDPEALAGAVDAFFARTDRETMERHAADAARMYSWEEYGALFRRLVAGE